jgi:hypothetical protein
MPTQAKDLKPCDFVWCRISVNGGCRYRRDNPDIETEDKREVARWGTEREIDDTDEHAAAQALRNRIKRAMFNLGAKAGGSLLIIGVDNRELFTRTERKLRAEVEVDQFNAQSRYTKVTMNVSRWRIRGENEDVLKDLLSGLRGTLDDLKRALKAADYKDIRKVVLRLKGYDMVLPEEANDFLERAIADARAQATAIRKEVEKRGREAEELQDEISTSSVDYARFALMEPGTELDDVDNPLVSDMVEAQAGERAAGLLLGGNDNDYSDGTSEGYAASGSDSTAVPYMF